MSVSRKLFIGLSGAAVMATGLASAANAHVVAAGAGACEVYAGEYAAVHTPQFGLAGWNSAYAYAYNQCLAGGPSFASASPYGYAHQGPFGTLGTALAVPVVAAANVAGAVVNAGVSVAGAVLSVPAAIATGTVAGFAPATIETAPVIEPAAAPAPVVRKNYRGTYEIAQPVM